MNKWKKTKHNPSHVIQTELIPAGQVGRSGLGRCAGIEDNNRSEAAQLVKSTPHQDGLSLVDYILSVT